LAKRSLGPQPFHDTTLDLDCQSGEPHGCSVSRHLHSQGLVG